jgi:cardiolipin synthase
MDTMGQISEGAGWIASALGVIGVIAIAVVVTRMFSSWGNRSRILHATGSPAVTTPEFMHTLGGLVSRASRTGAVVEVLQNGDEFLPRFLEDIRGARRHIHLANYIWSDGSMLGEIVETLCQKAREGIEVRVLMDSFGALDASDQTLDALRGCGVQVEKFRPFVFGKITRYHRRSHRRAIVIDGAIGYTGGIAFDDRWLGNGTLEHKWRDQMFRLRGPIVHDVQGSFAQHWAAVRGEILSGAHMYPPLESDAIENSYVHLSSSPTEDTQPMDKFLWLIINAARRTLYITNYIFIVDKAIRRALIERAIAGVDVRILLPGILDTKFTRFASHSYYDDLLKAGVRFYEFQPAMLHSKTIVVDGILSVFGSVNLDVRSKKWNEEILFAVQDRTLASRLVETFLHDLKQSKEIRWEDWKNRGYLKRAVEHISVAFSEQF